MVNNSNRKNGYTLVEIIFVIFMIVLFSSILISNFPSIEKSFYLTRAANKLSQDIRKVEGLSLSGSLAKDQNGEDVKISGYGIYLNTLTNDHQYILYADSCPQGAFDEAYTPPGPNCLSGDLIIDTIDLTTYGSELYMKEDIANVQGGRELNVLFSPPNPSTSIQNLNQGATEIKIVLGLRSDQNRTKEIWLNKAGLIYIK